MTTLGYTGYEIRRRLTARSFMYNKHKYALAFVVCSVCKMLCGIKKLSDILLGR